VNYAVSGGTATAGQEYVPLIDSSVNFAAEQSVALVELTPKEINQVEGRRR